MAVITAETSPAFKDSIRQLAQDDGSEQALDRVDVTNRDLLNNSKAAMNAIGGAAADATQARDKEKEEEKRAATGQNEN